MKTKATTEKSNKRKNLEWPGDNLIL